MPLPVVHTLTPAGVEQVHLGIDLGTQQFRANVGIYNAGPSEAHAALELRRSCDDVVVQRRFVTVPGDSVTQVTGVNDDPQLSGNSCSSSGAAYFSRYVVVVMDQPGFSFVTSLAKELPPRIGITTSSVR
jgi:hypothetical protein